MFYEVIYETGNHSMASYDTDDEAREALEEQHRRAQEGEKGGPTGHAAERIVKVLKYDSHPASLNESQALPASEVIAAFNKCVSEKAVGDLVSVPEIAASLRELTSPVVESGPHESNFKAEESAELSGAWKS